MYEAIERSAPGKVILCGEHSVVYGRPAVAVPVSNLRARAFVVPGAPGSGMQFRMLNLNQSFRLADIDVGHPLGRVAHLVLAHLRATEPDAVLTVDSAIPIASGMGSGASVAAATARALAAYLGHELSLEAVSEITFEVERIHHGTPSGIDNTVVAWERPVYFVMGRCPETFPIAVPFRLLIASSGIVSSTREAIADVRRRWIASPDYYEIIFNCIGVIAKAAREAVQQGALHALGTLLNENHELLAKMGLSLPELDRMVVAARAAGALGAKLTGAGQGGNVIALVEVETADAVRESLRQSGAKHIWEATIGSEQ